MGKFSFPRLIIRMPWAKRTAQDDFCTETTELHRPRTHQPHNSSQLPSLNVCRQGKENTDSTQKKRKKKRLNEKGTQVELGMREDIHDLDLAHWRLARQTWRTERGNMREIKALYGEIFRLHQLLEEIGVDKGVIKQRSTSSILCPVSPTLPAFPWYNLHRYLANSQSEPDQHAAGTQKDPSKKHSIFPPLDTQSCTSPDKWPHSQSKKSHPHASHRFAVPSHPLASGPPARMRQTHPHVHPRFSLTGQEKVKEEVYRPEITSSEELSEEVQRRGAEIANMYKAQLKERMAQKRKEEILNKGVNNDDKNDDTEASCSSAVKHSNTLARAPERPASPDATPVAAREDTQGETQQDLADVVNVLKRQSSDLYLPDDVCEESLTWMSIYEELCPLAHRVNTEADYIKALRIITEKAVTPSCSSEDDVSQSVSEVTSQEGSSESEESMSGQQQRCLHREPYGERDRKEIDSGKMEGRYATANALSMMASRGKEELNAMSYADRIKYFKDEAKRNEEMMKIERRKENARDEELKKWEKRQKKLKKLNEEERKRTENMEKNKLEEQRKREKAEMKLKIEHEKKRQEQEKKREEKERKKQEMQQKARAKEEKKRAEEEKKMEKKRAEMLKKIEKQRMVEERNREKERMKVLEMQQKAREKEEKRRKEEQKRRLKIQQEQEKEEQKRQTRIRDEDKKRAELQRIKDHEARFKMEMEKLYEREERNAQIEREKRRALCQKKGQTQKAKQVVAYEVTASTSDASVRREEREQRPETAHAQSAKRRTRKKQKKAADEALTTFE
ncbi:golgin subfamily A member 6-like protein 24 [Salvelinus fontinalis]|uniref:golgin subfamily A member 6-like protein 24 n=1 Tax=Salvelinus fontinalis TaxID=8038 RepID=UPI00248599AC|nr:golgin subfamily A member 6-like protein 24 [Salvelinus fontinalis]